MKLPIAGHGRVPRFAKVERLSLELTRACSKGCDFCYNGSHPKGEQTWTNQEILDLAEDCIAHGLRALSFGGGEPLQYPGLWELLQTLRGRCYLSLTSNGLLLEHHLSRLLESRPNKVHVSIHFPDNQEEVARVCRQVSHLEAHGISAGVNLLIRRSKLGAARTARLALDNAGIKHEQILYLPMRGQDTPSPKELSQVAGTESFQSVTCLLSCAASHRFASLDWSKRAAWCSYTQSRRPLKSATYRDLVAALTGLGLQPCS